MSQTYVAMIVIGLPIAILIVGMAIASWRAEQPSTRVTDERMATLEQAVRRLEQAVHDLEQEEENNDAD